MRKDIKYYTFQQKFRVLFAYARQLFIPLLVQFGTFIVGKNML